MPLCISRRWHLRQLIAASSLVLLVACAEKPTAADAQPLQTLPVATAPAVIPPVVPTGENLDIQPTQTFAEWQAGFRKDALAAGIRADLFDRAFANVSLDTSVIRADRSQPEFSRPVWEYLDGALSPLRVRKVRHWSASTPTSCKVSNNATASIVRHWLRCGAWKVTSASFRAASR